LRHARCGGPRGPPQSFPARLSGKAHDRLAELFAPVEVIPGLDSGGEGEDPVDDRDDPVLGHESHHSQEFRGIAH